ncbi:MAG: cytochrome d ubiquinol oxidase subunit II [Candidatus Aminicenantes bacterium]|nr:cytochrome d ubiquinol oxidase subunit II [Candidatus Aminicenantes bacterium]
METWDILRHIWFFLIGVLFVGYSILDGFDLGIGILFPFLGKKEEEKKALVKAIGPFWDGNEVWILTGGGALFAAFPHAYATVFSGFYLALMVVLFSLIFRAVSLEFRSHDTKRKAFWEGAFIGGSFLPSLLFGVAVGNVVIGVPLDQSMNFTGNFFALLRPFPLVLGLLGLTAFLMQGSTYAAMKTDGIVQTRARKAAKTVWNLYTLFLLLALIVTFITFGEALSNVPAWVCTAAVIFALAVLRNALGKAKDALAFWMSSTAFLGLWGIVGAIHFPNLVKANNDPALSLTITNASSSELTLKVMLVIALIGMPLVIGYTIYLYKVFRGKVRVEPNG